MHEKLTSDGEGYFFEVGLHDIFRPPSVPTRNILTYKYVQPSFGQRPTVSSGKI